MNSTTKPPPSKPARKRKARAAPTREQLVARMTKWAIVARATVRAVADEMEEIREAAQDNANPLSDLLDKCAAHEAATMLSEAGSALANVLLNIGHTDAGVSFPDVTGLAAQMRGKAVKS